MINKVYGLFITWNRTDELISLYSTKENLKKGLKEYTLKEIKSGIERGISESTMKKYLKAKISTKEIEVL